MPEATDTTYLSIGEVLGLLLEEFPDVTISKIRFLESQGLISPERTASGYRKFYDHDVQLLRVILTEQHEHYLPLRVIKDRLDSGEIDRTGEHLRPNGHGAGQADAVDQPDDHTPAEIPAASIRSHPASRTPPDVDVSQTAAPNGQAPAAAVDATPQPESRSDSDHQHAATDRRVPEAEPEPAVAAATLLPGVLLDRAELCAMAGVTDAELAQLESFGIVGPTNKSGAAVYGDDAVSIAKPAAEFLRIGIDARHLRNWRTSADREASLYEQLVTPRYRQRNPESRAEALAQLRRLDALGASLRAAMTRQALRHHFES